MTEDRQPDHSHFRGYVTQKAVILNPATQVLLVRSSADRPWSIPGGRIHEDESATDGIVREIREETTLDVDIGPPVQTLTDVWYTSEGEPMFTVVYASETQDEDVVLNHEHEEFQWVPVSEAKQQLPLPGLTTAVERTESVLR